MSTERHVTIKFKIEVAEKECFCDVCRASKQTDVTRFSSGEEFFAMRVNRVDYKLTEKMGLIKVGMHVSNKRRVCKRCFRKIHSFLNPGRDPVETVGAEYALLENKVRLEARTIVEKGNPGHCMCNCGNAIGHGEACVGKNDHELVCTDCFSTVSIVTGKILN